MTPLENKCLYIAEKMHEGVSYGRGLNMLDQIKGTYALMAENTKLNGKERENALSAVFLHKCWEKKRIAENLEPMTMDDIEKHTNKDVRRIVEELASEPDEKASQTKMEQWQEKAQWSKGLSLAAREILLAEKVQNFMVSRDKPNPNKTPEWHKEYIKSRMLMVEALKETNENLYQAACNVKDTIEEKLKVIDSNKKLNNPLNQNTNMKERE